MRNVVLLVMVGLAVCENIPGPPTDLQVTDVQRHNMSISWKRPDNSTDLTYTVFYKGNESCWQEIITKDTKATLLKMKPYTIYEIFVMANYKGAYSPPSERVSNTTLEAEPEGCPDYTFETGGIELGIYLEWKSKAKNGKVKYKVFYKNCSMENPAVIEGDRIYNVDPDDEYFDVRNLPSTGFQVKVVAYTSAGYCKGHENMPYKTEKNTTACPSPMPSITVSPSSTPKAATSLATPDSKTTTQEIQTSTKVFTTHQAPTTTHISPTSTIQITTTQTTEPTSKPTEPTKEPVKCTQEPTDESGTEQPGEKLTSKKDNNWLLYVAIALAVIVVIMGITIFLLIWQLYRNHRFYRLRREEQYNMSRANNPGHDNRGQDNP